MDLDPLPDHVHVDARWVEGGIARYAANAISPIIGGGRRLGGRGRPANPAGQLEMAARFAPLAARGALLLSPGFSPPFGSEHRSIVTVHDLHYLDALIASPSRRRYFTHVVMRQLRRCRLVLTVSETSGRQIRDALGTGGPDVVLVGNGVDPVLLDVEQDRPRDRGRLLFVGGDKTNKNLPPALRAFARVRGGTGAELVVVGAVSDDVALHAPDGVRFVGAVSDAELMRWYGRSTALLMPSISEGFGLPALEAMVAGTPVIFGDRDALPEVVGAHGWPVDPFDVASIAAGIEAALTHPVDIGRHERRRLADRHRWVDVAERVRVAVESVL